MRQQIARTKVDRSLAAGNAVGSPVRPCAPATAISGPHHALSARRQCLPAHRRNRRCPAGCAGEASSIALRYSAWCRANLADPTILAFNLATSAVDVSTEPRIQAAAYPSAFFRLSGGIETPFAVGTPTEYPQIGTPEGGKRRKAADAKPPEYRGL